MRIAAFLLIAFATVSAHADSQGTPIVCSYSFMGMPTWKITIVHFDDDSFAASAEVDMYNGKPIKSRFSPVTPQAGEWLHAWLDKDDPNNSLEMIIYSQKQSQGWSKMINSRMPLGKELWGDCTGLPSL